MVASLIRLATLVKDDWESALEQILVIDSASLDVARVSYWSIRSDPAELFCELCYVGTKRRYERGTTLQQRDCPSYMRALQERGPVVVEDVLADARTSGLARYFGARSISSLLDVLVFVRGEPVGILSHEHIGPPRRWTVGDQEFAMAVGQTIATTLEARSRTRAEDAERRALFLSSLDSALMESLDPVNVCAQAAQRALPRIGEMAVLRLLEDGRPWPPSFSHVSPEGRARLEEFIHRSGRSDLRGVAREAMDLTQSVVIPLSLEAHMAACGYPADSVEALRGLSVSSAMAIPLSAGRHLRGVFVFAVTTRRYDHDDLRLAEAYVGRVSVALHNAWLHRQLEDALRTRDQFLSLASHELRTPLTTLRLATEAMARRMEAAPETVKLATSLIRQVDRLDRLAGRLLDVCRATASGFELRVERVDLVDLVRGVTRELSGLMERAGCALVLRAKGSVLVQADPVLVERAASNLLENAAKFASGKPIEVSVHARDDRAVLSVRDNGAGIAGAGGDLFRRYQRGHSAEGRGGLGLGLYVVSEIVRAHGGTFTVESCPGAGARFVVELPRYTGDRGASE